MQQNKRIFLKGISYSYIYIFAYLVVGIFTTPMLLNYFKADYFALLMLVYTIITYLNNIRFGLPESLAALLAKSDNNSFNKYLVKKSLLIIIMIVLLFVILFYLLGIFISDWRFFLGDVYALNKNDVLNVFYILISFALVRIPLDISLQVFIGYHEVYLEKIYKILNLIVNFILIIFVINTQQSIVFFALWAGILDLTISVISFIHSMLKYNIFKEKEIKKYIGSKEILKNGILFFQLSLIQTIIWGAGILVVSHMLTLADVTVYSLTMKIYVYIFYAFIIVNSVLAPMYGKYFTKNDWESIENIFNFTILILPFVGGYIWISTLFIMSDIIALWTGSEEFFIGSVFVLFMGLFFYLTGYVNSFITLLYSIGEAKSIVFVRYKEVIANLMISVVATYFFGLVGIAIGISFAIILSASYLPKYIKDKTNNQITLELNIQKKHLFLILLPSVLIALIVSVIVKVFIVKMILFVVASFVYIFASWYILSFRDKLYILNFLSDRKDQN